MKINNTANYISTQRNKKVSFNSISTVAKSANEQVTKATNWALSPLLLKASKNKTLNRFVNWVGSSERGITHLFFIDSAILSSFYMINTAKNKNIEKKQKLPLIINQGLVFGISAICTYKVDDIINNKFKIFADEYKKISKSKNIESTLKGIKNLKSIVLLGLIYRFIAPVFMTPVANKISEKIQHRHDEKKASAQNKMQSVKA